MQIYQIIHISFSLLMLKLPFTWCQSSQNQGIKLSLIGSPSKQLGIRPEVSSLAIDGDVTTYSIACELCNNVVSTNPWWQVDLQNNYQVYIVTITSSSDFTNAQYLENFSIHVSLTDENNLKPLSNTLCYYFNTGNIIGAGQTQSFTCSNGPILGRYLTIIRQGGKVRPDAISLAEVGVFLSPSDVPSSGNQIVLPNNANVQYQAAPIINRGFISTQSCTCTNLQSNLALDNDVGTSSLTCGSCISESNVGWWSVNLAQIYPIYGLKIIASHLQTYSGFLNYFNMYVANNSVTQNKNFPNSRQLCATYNNAKLTQINQVIDLKCNQVPIYGQNIIIEKISLNYPSPEAISLAEVFVLQAAMVNPSPNIIPSLISNPSLEATQSCTYQQREAYLALDNNDNTASTADNTCLSAGQLAWWSVDLQQNFNIYSLQVIASVNSYDAQYLMGFSIYVANSIDLNSKNFKNTRKLCFNYESGSVSSLKVLNIICTNVLSGRYVILERNANSFRSDALSLTQVNIFQIGIPTSNQILPSNPQYDTDKISTTINSGESCICGNQIANLALDNNPNTYSISCNKECSNITNLPGSWWVDLSIVYPIFGVSLTASNHDYDAKYLDGLSIYVSQQQDLSNRQLCTTYNPVAGTSFLPRQIINLNCNSIPTLGRYVIIERNNLNSFRYDAIGFTQVDVLRAITRTSTG